METEDANVQAKMVVLRLTQENPKSDECQISPCDINALIIKQSGYENYGEEHIR